MVSGVSFLRTEVRRQLAKNWKKKHSIGTLFSVICLLTPDTQNNIVFGKLLAGHNTSSYLKNS